MNRSELSRLYREHGLKLVHSTKLPEPVKHKNKKHKLEYAAKPDPHKHLHAPEVVKGYVKPHVSTPYEEAQLQIQKLKDQLMIEKKANRQFLKIIALLLENPEDQEFAVQQIKIKLNEAKPNKRRES